MNQVITAANPYNKAFIYARPNGTKELAGVVAFDDEAVRRVMGDFDGRERITAYVPVEGRRAWQPIATAYQGTTRDGVDLHSFTVDVGDMKVDVPALIGKGFARSAEVSGPRGREDLHLQHFGENARVYDVGRVDEHGINWMSPVTATRIQRYSRTPQLLQEGETIVFHKHAFGAPGNLMFDFDVFAPALTPLAAVEGRERHDEIAESLGLRAETDALPVGDRNVPLQYVGNAGPEGNDIKLGFSLADGVFVNRLPGPGLYEFRILKGDVPVRTFKLDLRD